MFDGQQHNPLRREVPGHLFSFQEKIFGMTLPQFLSDVGGGLLLVSATGGVPLVPRLVVCLVLSLTLLTLVHTRVQGYTMIVWLYLIARFTLITKLAVWRPVKVQSAKGEPASIQQTWFRLDAIDKGVMCYRAVSQKVETVYYWVAFSVEAVQNSSFLPEGDQIRFYGRIKAFLDGLSFPLKFLSQVESTDPASDPGLLEQEKAVVALADYPQLQKLQRAILGTQRQEVQQATKKSHYVIISANSQEIAVARLGNIFRSPLSSLFSLFKARNQKPVASAQVMDELRIRVSVVKKMLATLDVRASLLDDSAMLHIFAASLAPGASLPSFEVEIEDLAFIEASEVQSARRIPPVSASHVEQSEERAFTPMPGEELQPVFQVLAQTKAVRKQWKKRIRGLHRTFVYQSMNKNKRFEDGVLALPDLLAPTSITIQKDAVEVDVRGHKRYQRYFEVTGYGSDLICGWQEELTALGLPMIVVTKCDPLDSRMMIKKLELHLTKLESSHITDQKKQRRSPAEQRIEAEQVRSIIDSLARKKLKIFTVQMVIGIHAGSKERLEQRSDYLCSHLRDMQISVRALSRRHDVGWQFLLPTCIDTGLDFFTNVPSDVLATFANWSTGIVGTPTGAFLGTTGSSFSKQLIRLNPWDLFKRLPNPHVTICGESGMGKSWLVKQIILGLLCSSIADAVVMDRDGDYDAIHAFLGPQESQRFNLAGTIPFNPFDLPYGPVDVNLEEKIDLLAEFIDNHLLTGLSFVYGDAFSKSQEALLTQAARQAYAKRDITMEAIWNDPKALLREPPTFREFIEVIKTIPASSESVRQTLVERFENVAYLFPGQTAVQFGKPLIIFNINKLDEKWYPLMVYVIQTFLMRHRALKRDERYLAYVIEEASYLLKHPSGKRYLETGSRGFRKLGIAQFVVSQHPADFLEEGQIILANSATNIFLGMQRQAAQRLGLAEELERVLEEAVAGRAVIRCGREYAALDVTHGSPLHRAILTTDPVEQRKLRQKRQQRQTVGSTSA